MTHTFARVERLRPEANEAGRGALATVLRIMGWLCISVSVGIILISYGWTWYTRGFSSLQGLLSPFNTFNAIAVAITLAPGHFLLRLADAVKNRRRQAREAGLVVLAFCVAGSFFALTVFDVLGARTPSADGPRDPRVRESQATAIRVRNNSATMVERGSTLGSKWTGPVKGGPLPEIIRIGDTITLSGKSIRVGVIEVSEYLVDMKWGGEVLAQAGDVRCVIAASEDSLPSRHEDHRPTLWVTVMECEPLAG
jgi:hypothetical protein